MALTPSNMVKLGSPAPVFELTDATTGWLVRLEDFKDKAVLLGVFMCNHCPYVKHIREGLAQFAHDYQNKDFAMVGINSNDVVNYPDDSPDKMAEEVKAAGYIFPYLFDETQAVAKSYEAACTPDFFLYDKKRTLAYRGQFDDSRPGNNMPVTGTDLRQAVDTLLSGRRVGRDQKPSMGCNIKWKQE